MMLQRAPAGQIPDIAFDIEANQRAAGAAAKRARQEVA